VGYTADAPGGQNHAMAVFRTKYIGAVGNSTCGRVGKVFNMMENVNMRNFNADQPCRKIASVKNTSELVFVSYTWPSTAKSIESADQSTLNV
jgi:hypothetical protein